MTDLIERLRAHASGHLPLGWTDERMLLEEAAAALEAEASEGERRGLEAHAEAAFASVRTYLEGQAPSTCSGGIRNSDLRALIPEAPAQPELASAAANQISTTEVGLQEAPAREGELEAAAKAIFEQKGLHLSTGKAWERAIRSDRYYCLQYAEAVLIAIGRLPPPPPQDRQPDSQRGAK